MFCEIGQEYGIVPVWFAFTVASFLLTLCLSGSLFHALYVHPTFEAWQYKCNPKFPSPQLVRKEIIHTVKGMVVATIIPAYSITASWTKSYCGNPYHKDVWGFCLEVAFIVVFTDFVEYLYHYMGHRFAFFWSIHKHHHHFYNPSPFAVIADEWPDQFCRTIPMIAIPALLPTNMDLLFLTFGILFYGYGVYLHGGYELPGLSAHNPILNTSYHHYHHHAASVLGKPIYTGFFVKLWDWIFDSRQDIRNCTCVDCRPAEERSCLVWAKTVKPNYSVLLSPSWWTKQSLDVSE